MKYKVQYKKVKYTVEVSDKNTKVYDSYKIKDLSDMLNFIEHLRKRFPNSSVTKVSLFDTISEWRTHNLLYTLGIKKSRTKDVDLNTGNPWYIKTVYAVVSPFYFNFY